MIYYKITDGENIIGAISQTSLMKYQEKHHIMISSDIKDAQYAVYNDTYYHDDWMRPVEDGADYYQASIMRIEEDEYEALAHALETGEIIEVIEPTIVEVEESIEEDNTSLDFVKEMKLKEISMACEKAIVSGIDVVLEDGESHHFSLDLESQINLMSLASLVASGTDAVPYHADGELCRYFTANEINAIMTQATAHKTYNTTYHNSLKAYVESLEDINDVHNVYYGMDVPVQYQSDIFKTMLAEAQNS